MSKFDLESFRDLYLDLVKSNIASKISEINTEKNDGVILEVPSASHFIRNIDDQALSFDPFIHYGFSEIDAESNAGAVVYEATLFFAFYFIDRGEGSIAESKILRYTRAITEIISENAHKSGMVSNLQIKALPPSIVSFSDPETDESAYNVGAVELTGSIYT